MEGEQPIKIAVTGAAGQIGTFLCHFISQGRMFGPNKMIHLHLIELPHAMKVLDGLVMELIDGAYDLVSEISTFDNANNGFKDIDVAILVGSRPRGPGMQRAELIECNAKIF
jgi:malate dehydrogenase